MTKMQMRKTQMTTTTRRTRATSMLTWAKRSSLRKGAIEESPGLAFSRRSSPRRQAAIAAMIDAGVRGEQQTCVAVCAPQGSRVSCLLFIQLLVVCLSQQAGRVRRCLPAGASPPTSYPPVGHLLAMMHHASAGDRCVLGRCCPALLPAIGGIFRRHASPAASSSFISFIFIFIPRAPPLPHFRTSPACGTTVAAPPRAAGPPAGAVSARINCLVVRGRGDDRRMRAGAWWFWEVVVAGGGWRRCLRSCWLCSPFSPT